MQSKSMWLKIFSAGVALIVLTSVTTAALMKSRYSGQYSAVISERDALKAATGSTGETTLTNGSNPQKSALSENQTTPALQTGLTQSSSPASTTGSEPASGTVTTSPTSGALSTTPSATSTSAATTAKSTTTAKTTTTANQTITAAQAQQIALNRIHTDGLRVVDTELRIDKYPPIYEVKLIDNQYKYEVEIHAVTGQVIEIEKET